MYHIGHAGHLINTKYFLIKEVEDKYINITMVKMI